MSRNKVIMIIIAALALLFILGLSLTEYREVSANEWREKFNYNDQQPQGLYIFKELTSRYFEDIPNTINGYAEDTTNINSLYIQFVSDFLMKDETDTLLSIANAGNDVLIIADFYNINIGDTLTHYFDDHFLSDSSMTFNFTDQKLSADTNYIYQFHDQKFEPNELKDFYLLKGYDWSLDQEHIKVITPDSLILMVAFPFGKGRIFYHVKRDLFYNYSYRQPQMFEYTQKVLSHFDPQHVYMLNPITVYGSEDDASTNPLEFIMSQPALKTAYYLLLFGTLLFVFFGGKRKQKIIPVTVKNKNTSLEYIDTVSQLFYQQGQHEKLVAHMKSIFHHKMQKKFFVAPDNPNYVDVLAKKSKISKTELQYIVDRFQNLDDSFNFRGDQLVSLNRRLEHIYKEIENG